MERSNPPIELQYHSAPSPVRDRAGSSAKWLSLFADVSAFAVYLWFYTYVPFHLRTVQSDKWMQFVALASVGSSMAVLALGGFLLLRRRWRFGSIVIVNGAVYWAILVVQRAPISPAGGKPDGCDFQRRSKTN